MTVSELVNALVAANASPDVIKISVDAFVGAIGLDEKKISRQERNRRYYAKRLNKTEAKTDSDVLKESENVSKASENAPSRVRARVLYREEVKIDNPIEPSVLSLPSKAKRVKVRRAIEADEQPSAQNSADASNLSPAVFRSEWQKFRDYHLAKGSLMADWSAAWRTWLGNVGQFQRAGPRPYGNGKPSLQDTAKNLYAKLYGNSDADLFAPEGDAIRNGSIRLLSTG